MKIALKIPGPSGAPIQIDTGLPDGVPHGDYPQIFLVLLSCLALGAVLFAIYQLLSGGISIIMSKGDKERFAKGRDKVFQTIIGIIVVVVVFAVIRIFADFTGLPLLWFLHKP